MKILRIFGNFPLFGPLVWDALYTQLIIYTHPSVYAWIIYIQNDLWRAVVVICNFTQIENKRARMKAMVYFGSHVEKVDTVLTLPWHDHLHR